MIVILADDLSGAAELAGIAWRLGLSSEVHLEFDPESTAEVVAVDTDSRSLSPGAAAERVGKICRQILGAGPAWIYKKTDSVLRGNLAREISAILDAAELSRCLFVPANPSKDRIVEGGRYFVGGIPLTETIFSEDPEFPAWSDSVRELLGPDLDSRIEVPETVTAANLGSLAAGVDAETLGAGAADFFEAILRREKADSIKEGAAVDPTGFDRSGARLFVCGSRAAWPERKAFFESAGYAVFTFPEGNEEAEWRSRIAKQLRRGQPVLAAIGDPPSRRLEPSELVRAFGAAVAKLLTEAGDAIGTGFLEGGATAIAVLSEMNESQFRVVGESGPGAPFLESVRNTGPIFCPKPGSYPWPPGVFR